MRLTRRGRLMRSAVLVTVAGVVVSTTFAGPGHADRRQDTTDSRTTADPAAEIVGLRSWTSTAEREVRRYRLTVERGLPANRHRFARVVGEALTDRRGWGRDFTFRRVRSDRAAFTIVLASPKRTDELCAPMVTNGIYSCFNHGRAVINRYRWTHGAQTYGWRRHLPLYRHYVVLHEVGHAVGHGHRYHCRADGLAPTMMQQTKSLYGCVRNAWPYP